MRSSTRRCVLPDGFQLDDAHVGLDEIHKVGPGKELRLRADDAQEI